MKLNTKCLYTFPVCFLFCFTLDFFPSGFPFLLRFSTPVYSYIFLTFLLFLNRHTVLATAQIITSTVQNAHLYIIIAGVALKSALWVYYLRTYTISYLVSLLSVGTGYFSFRISAIVLILFGRPLLVCLQISD